MPFDDKTASVAGSKGGKARWKHRNPEDKRDKKLMITVSQNEADEIDGKAEALKISRTELVVQAVKNFNAKNRLFSTSQN